MERRLITAVLACAILCWSSRSAMADTVGYVNHTFYVGDNLFTNPLDNTNGNFVSSLIPSPPEGTVLSLWDPASASYTATYTFTSGVWTWDCQLPVGVGAKLNTATEFTGTFVGAVLDLDGTPFDGENVTPPAPFSGPDGIYLQGSACPMSLPRGDLSLSTFMALFGREAHEGEQFTWLDASTQTWQTTTLAGGAWTNGEPSLAIADAGLFNIGPVPEPPSALLALLGMGAIGLIAVARRRRRNGEPCTFQR